MKIIIKNNNKNNNQNSIQGNQENSEIDINQENLKIKYIKPFERLKYNFPTTEPVQIISFILELPEIPKEYKNHELAKKSILHLGKITITGIKADDKFPFFKSQQDLALFNTSNKIKKSLLKPKTTEYQKERKILKINFDYIKISGFQYLVQHGEEGSKSQVCGINLKITSLLNPDSFFETNVSIPRVSHLTVLNYEFDSNIFGDCCEFKFLSNYGGSEFMFGKISMF
ncbi:hypothetical protein M0811_02691 [Anaeramoeba ignava]|uniref:Uncharacterized protein n=1 Tax=Anaeramoeba ignava TaxID=1746090 RepID=A0A9Q0L9S2_ANAIG|nr:hypothetical protein M0811_02691 [Anaeramoeba ignava]